MSINKVAFLFCLPIARQAFELTNNSDRHDFARHFIRQGADNLLPHFESYRKEILEPYNRLKHVYSDRMDISFVDKATLSDISDHCNDNQKAVILFSHCINNGDFENEMIEFPEGLAKWRKIFDFVPIDFEGLVDLAVCRPDVLAAQLKLHRQKTIVKSTAKSIKLIYWLYFYAELFKNMIEEKIDYLDSLEFTLSTLKQKYAR